LVPIQIQLNFARNYLLGFSFEQLLRRASYYVFERYLVILSKLGDTLVHAVCLAGLVSLNTITQALVESVLFLAAKLRHTGLSLDFDNIKLLVIGLF